MTKEQPQKPRATVPLFLHAITHYMRLTRKLRRVPSLGDGGSRRIDRLLLEFASESHYVKLTMREWGCQTTDPITMLRSASAYLIVSRAEL